MTDDQQLHDLFNRMCLAWTNGDARAYGACFTAIHNGRIRPVGVPEPDSLPAKVARGLVRATGALGIGRARPNHPHVPAA